MTFSSRTEFTKDDWRTPLYIVKALGEFDLDPCADIVEPTRLAKHGYTIEDDGLEKEWFGRVFVNPPYGYEVQDWMEKLGEYGNGVALIPPRVGAKWFHNIVFSRCDAILFLKGRVSFIDWEGYAVDGNNADSILVAYGEQNVQSLSVCGLEGVLWKLKA